MVIEENVTFQAIDLKIEGSIAYDDAVCQSPCVIICPSHPQLGGDMDNNVVTALHQHAAGKKFIIFRFNYRGVGKSWAQENDHRCIEDVKAFWENSWSPLDELRIQDAIGAVDFIKGVQAVSQDLIFLVGYSFGAYVACQTVVEFPQAAALVLISPTIHLHDFTALNKITIPKMVVSGDNDFSYSMMEQFSNSFKYFFQRRTKYVSNLR